MHLERIRSVIDGLLAACQREPLSKSNALSPGIAPKVENLYPLTTATGGVVPPFKAAPSIEAELAPESASLGEEVPRTSTPAHINEACETTSPTAFGQNHEDALPENATHDDFVR
ncbi:hypothetical protein BKA80DRAFT_299430 [Phyllosticta citrichinensis]